MRRTQIQTLTEFLMSPFIVKCRCVRCGVSAYRLARTVPAQKKKSVSRS
jgi:hypothetical protein